ncbi:MAG: triose-phosphate isomerase [Planctomycetaceae bacterium]
MRRPLIAGNWKMNTSRSGAVELAKVLAEGGSDAAEVLVCPPFTWLCEVAGAVDGSSVQVGAQNCWHEPSGAFTGETSVDMLKEAGCSYVILGHSERRHVIGETDEMINQKSKAALSGGLKVILCVGELLEEREAEKTEEVLTTQMAGGLAGIDDLTDVVIAYEPVWAIGTGKTATPDQAEAAHAHLRKWVENNYTAEFAAGIRILYGGSVKPDNAATLLSQENVDGALVGGASLKPDLFLPIIAAAG